MSAPAAAPVGPVGPVRGVAGDVAGRRVLARTCAAEWSRLWTVKATWWFLAAAAVAMLGIGAVAGNDAAGDPVTATRDPAWLAATVTALPGQFAVLALALTAVTSDHATGGIVATLQWTTRRTTVFLARTLVVVGTVTAVGVLLGLAAAVAAFVAARSALGLPLDEGLDALGTVAFVFGAGAALAVGLGFLLRSTAGALVSVFLLVVVLPLLLGNLGYEWLASLALRLPGSGAVSLLTDDVEGMTTTSSVAVLLAWAGGALVLGWARLVSTDADR